MQLSPISLAITRLGGVRFSPSALFSSGEQGAWYDPSDFGTTGTGGVGTLFQDSAGTTPVTAVEQPVGLVLDKSKGLVLGSELVTNGNFSAGSTGWTAVSGWAITSQQAVATATSSSLYGGSVTSVSGRWYRVEFDVISYTSGDLYITVGGNYSGNPMLTGSAMAAGRKTMYVLGGANTTRGVEFYGGTITCTIDNISVRELAGNHAYQTTSASRPTLRARYNLLTYSEQFDNVAWTKLGTAPTVTANATIAPDGTNTADKIVFNASGIANRINQNLAASLGVISITLSIYLRGEVGGEILQLSDGWTNSSDLVLTTTWQRFTVPLTGNATSTAFMLFAKTGTPTCYAWGAQLTQTAVFPSNTYQRIADAATYATGAAFPPYLFFDGVDDSLLTNSVDFSATDKMTVWAGVTKNSDAARGMLLELSAVATNPGAFYVAAPDTAGTANYGMYLDPGAAYQPTTYTAPISNVISVAFNRAGATLADRVIPRINGIVNQTNPSTATPTGNFGNYPLYIGRRNNATLPLNGNIYSLIIRGAQSTAAQISSTESWVAAKTPLGSL